MNLINRYAAMRHYLTYVLSLCTIFSLFFIDLISMQLFEQSVMHTVILFYMHRLFHARVSVLIMALTAIALESLVLHNVFGSQLLIVLPLTVLGIRLKRIIPSTRILAHILGASAIALNYWVLEPLIMHTPLSIRYTSMKIAGNMVLSLIFH